MVRCVGVIAILSMAAAIKPAAAETPTETVQRAQVRIDALVDRYRRQGIRPTVDEVAAIERGLNEVAQACEASGDWAGQANALIKLEVAERMIARWGEAIHFAGWAIQAAQRAHDPGNEAKAFMDRAKAELAERKFGGALADAEQAVHLAAKSADAKPRFDTLDVLAQVDVALDRTNAAADAMKEALDEKGLKDEERFYGYLDRAAIFVRASERCDRMPIFEACLAAAARSRSDYLLAAESARRLGWTALVKQSNDFVAEMDNRMAMLRSRQQQAASVAMMRVFHPQHPSDVLVTERFAPVGGQVFPGLDQFYAEVRDADAKAGGFANSSKRRAVYVEGLMRQMQDDHAGALAQFMLATQGLDEDQRLLPDDTSRVTFFDEYFDMYLAATLEMLDAHRLNDAFAMMERSRARAMVDLLANRRLALGTGVEGGLYAERIRLEEEIAAQQTRLATLIKNNADETALAPVQTELGRRQEERRRVLARTAKVAPRLGQLTSARLISLAALQALAKAENSDVIEYLVTETNIVVWHIGPTEVQVRNVFLPRPQLQSTVASLLSQLKDADKPFDPTPVRELYLQLIQPIRSFIKSDRLVILPHDVLALLPFEALQDPSDGRYLGMHFQIAYAPSATVYAGLRRWAATSSRKALVIADPDLEVYGQEAQRVGAVYGARAKTINDVLVSKPALRPMLDGYDVVHLSVHGHFSGEQPMMSYLELAPEGPPGFLTAAEMFGLSLGKAGLVVLSACESGKFEASRGNEVVGMLRGLIYAGAGAVLLSRWSVHADTTALWMETFHRESLLGSLGEAARKAIVAVSSNLKFAHPHYWAAFTLVGRP